MPAILDYSGRFKVWDRPAVYPQVDLINGAPEGPVFDLDINSEDGGAVYLRVDHVEEMARIIGWKSPEEVAALLAENDALKNRIDNLPNTIEELKNGIDSCVRDFYSGLDRSPDLSVDDSEDKSEDAGITDTGSSDTIFDDIEGFGLDSFERPNELSGDSGNGESKPGNKS